MSPIAAVLYTCSTLLFRKYALVKKIMVPGYEVHNMYDGAARSLRHQKFKRVPRFAPGLPVSWCNKYIIVRMYQYVLYVCSYISLNRTRGVSLTTTWFALAARARGSRRGMSYEDRPAGTDKGQSPNAGCVCWVDRKNMRRVVLLCRFTSSRVRCAVFFVET